MSKHGLISIDEYNNSLIEIEVYSHKTFEQIADQWLFMKRGMIKESSYNKYKNILNSYILEEIGSFDLEIIREQDLLSLFQKLMSEGGSCQQGLSSKTLTEILCVIRSILNYARDLGYPVHATGRRIVIRPTQKKIRVFSRTEQDKLFRYLITHYSRKNLGIILCLSTGIRIGELCALRWSDISFLEQLLQVRHTIQRVQMNSDESRRTKIVISTPKSDFSIRDIPIPLEILDFLRGHKEEGYVLSGNEKIVEPRVMQYHFHKILKECGIAHANFHTLRHSFATRCVELGFDIKSLSEILGHTTVNITMNRYVHPSMELKKQQMQLLTQVFTLN